MLSRRALLASASLPALALAPAARRAGLRVSREASDPGYRTFYAAKKAGRRVKVFLDGVEQPACLTADEQTGFVKRCVLHVDGGIYVAPGTDEIMTEEVSGAVRIEIA